MIMRLVYIVSQYPSLNETFVAREMQQLVREGHEIIIFPLRPLENSTGPSGLVVRGASVLRSSLKPWDLAAAQLWLLRGNFAVWLSCWKDVFGARSKLSRLHHLAYILLATTWLARDLQPVEVDHIRGHFLHSEAVSSMWLGRMLQVKYSLTAHVVSIRYPQAIIARAVKEAAFVVSDTKEVYQLLSTMEPRGLHLIRNGINLENFPFRPPLYRLPGTPIILAVGSLFEAKGFDVLIQACAILYKKGVHFTCRIIGEGKERKSLEKMVRDLGLADLIQMPGSLSFGELLQEYVAAALFVMPSKNSVAGSDGLPTVLIESMAMGVPVVGTLKAGIPDLIEPGETGLMAEPDDAVSLADCIYSILKDGKLREKLALTGRKLIEDKFDIKSSTSKLITLMGTTTKNN